MNRITIKPENLTARIHFLWNDQWLLLSCGDFKNNEFNCMTVGWGSIGTMWSQPFVQVVVRPTRYTHLFMEKYPDKTLWIINPEGERIINVVREECRGWDPPSGVWVEEKGIALGLHYRRASAEDAERARRWFRARVKAADPGGRLRVIEGKRILEVRPGGLDKGLAVARMKRVAPTVTVYLGDDTTDEDAFAALEGNDLGILVGPGERPTAAGFRLADSGEARRFLRELAFRIREEGR